jgi:hypothetical protein
MSKKRQCIFLSESNAVLPLPPIIPPLTSPFSFELLNATTVNLATIDACVRDDDEVVALSAVINWSATFIPPASISTISILNTPGYADVTFEFLRNGVVIYRVTQTAAQKAIPLNQPTVIFTSAIPTYEIASMLFFDRIPICDSRHRKHSIYTVRATNIALVAPQVLVTGGASTTAEVGAITFVVKILNR